MSALSSSTVDRGRKMCLLFRKPVTNETTFHQSSGFSLSTGCWMCIQIGVSEIPSKGSPQFPVRHQKGSQAQSDFCQQSSSIVWLSPWFVFVNQGKVTKLADVLQRRWKCIINHFLNLQCWCKITKGPKINQNTLKMRVLLSNLTPNETCFMLLASHVW